MSNDKNQKLLTELQELVNESKLAAYCFAFGFIKVSAKLAKLLSLPVDDLGKCNDVLNRVNQSKFLKGDLVSARATLSGRLTTTQDDTPLGKVMATAMNNLVIDAKADVLEGKHPSGIERMRENGKTIIDYRLGVALLRDLGIKVADRSLDGIIKAVQSQVIANRRKSAPAETGAGRVTKEVKGSGTSSTEAPVEVTEPVAAAA